MLGRIFGSKSRSSSEAFVDKAQQPFLDFLRNTAQGLTGPAVPLANQFGRTQGADLYNQGLTMLGGLGNNPYLSSLQQQAVFDPQRVQGNINDLARQTGAFFNQQILPGLDSQYQGIGAFGGGRNQVTRGVAAGEIGRNFMSGVNDIYNNEYMRNLQAAGTGAGIYSQSMLGGLSQIPGLFNQGLSQFTGGFAPLLLMDQIVGAPTVLNSQRTKSSSGLLGSIGVNIG